MTVLEYLGHTFKLTMFSVGHLLRFFAHIILLRAFPLLLPLSPLFWKSPKPAVMSLASRQSLGNWTRELVLGLDCSLVSLYSLDTPRSESLTGLWARVLTVPCGTHQYYPIFDGGLEETYILLPQSFLIRSNRHFTFHFMKNVLNIPYIHKFDQV